MANKTLFKIMITKALWRTCYLSGMLLIAPCAKAQEKELKHRIDQWLAKQLENTASTSAMSAALHEAGQRWDKQMNASHK